MSGTAGGHPLLRLPLTYDECRARFREAAAGHGIEVSSHHLPVHGPYGQELTVDVAVLGAPRPERALVLMSGVHGVEGFIGSALQEDLLRRRGGEPWGERFGIVLVHAVNPWGMAWGRRQNESNVDLNRNWDRDVIEPPANDAYDELHPLACHDGPEPPDHEAFMAQAMAYVETRGLAWVRDAITVGQYTQPTGLHFGGDRTEASTRVVAEALTPHLAAAERSFSLDLHTGHGPYAEVTILSDSPPGSERDQWLREHLTGAAIEATADNPDATTATKLGQIGHGLARLVPGEHHAVTLEMGTVDDVEMMLAARDELWLHRHGDRSSEVGAAIAARFRRCYTPDEPEWAVRCLDLGRTVIDQAIEAIRS